jgi:NOL1/NOP2/sun family putative RNA methylase
LSHSELRVPAQSIPDGVLAILARYAAIVDDPQAWLNIAQQPLPVCLWSNPLKCDSERLYHYLTGLGLTPEPIGWQPGAFRVPQWPAPGRTLAFAAGWYYVQEEIAMTAVAALDPQPGDSILDLCAAPGGKTAQIAACLGATGTVMANEIHAARLPSLSVTINRLGLTQVITTQADGRSLSFPPQTFDRVLVDVPCSGEGNWRRRQQSRPWQPEHGLRIAAAQKKLLSRALDLVKPGGTVVYSTCTFAPEENEAVLDAVLGDRAILEPFDIPDLQAQSGLIHWQGQAYRSDLTRARRYWPHRNNTGGFFVAKLRRTEAPSVSSWSVVVPHLAPVDSETGSPLQRLAEQFGLSPERLTPYCGWATGKRRMWLLNADSQPLPGVPPQTLGMALATHTNLGLKPATAFLQRFGPYLQRQVVTLPDPAAAVTFLQGRSQPLTNPSSRGYVHVRYQDFELGCGWINHGHLLSQLPKTLRWL